MHSIAAEGAEVTEDALRPVTAQEKSWGWFAIFNVWANDIQSLFGYSLVASLFITYGVTGWTAFAALIASGLFVMFMVNLSGAAGERYGIPYPVLARASMGTEGAKLPAIATSGEGEFSWSIGIGVDLATATSGLGDVLKVLTGVLLGS